MDACIDVHCYKVALLLKISMFKNQNNTKSKFILKIFIIIKFTIYVCDVVSISSIFENTFRIIISKSIIFFFFISSYKIYILCMLNNS